jgi:hypothetical protein
MRLERAADAGLGTIARPALLHRLISQRPTPAILLGSKQWSMTIAGLLQECPELADQANVIQQNRAPLPTLAEHVEMLVIGRQVQVLQVQPQRLGDTQTRLEDQAEQEPIPPLCRRNLRGAGAEVKPEDVARLSPLGHEHINVLGRYSFALADRIAQGELRPLHHPDDSDELRIGAA